MMKKGIALLLAALMLLGSACAQSTVIQTPFNAVDMTLIPPEGYAVEQHIANDLAVVDLIPADAEALEYHIVVSRSDFEGAAEVSLSDLTEEQIQTMALQSAGEAAQIEYSVHTLDNGMMVLTVDEVGQTHEYAAGYAMIHGHLIGVRIDRHVQGLPLEEADFQALLDIFAAMTFDVQTPSVTGKVTEIEKYGHALLDITIADFNSAGFALGDVVTVTAGSYTGDMPYYDGYYVDSGEYMVRAYPGHENIAVCINYGKFAETAGIDVGGEVTIALKEKGAELATQEISALVYTNDRADYASDEIFANFRPIVMGGITEGRLYRSASPIDNEFGRAAISNKLAEAAGIKTVMNMGNTPEEIEALATEETFASAYYKGLYDEGGVIALGMPVNFTSAEFAQGIVQGLSFLSAHEPPYLLHCTEGKDRAGFTSMLLEALMGASLEEIMADYMLSFQNYYGVDAQEEPDKYEMIVSKNLMEMLYAVTGLEKGASLEDADLAAAAESYLLSNGMTAEAIEALKANLK